MATRTERAALGRTEDALDHKEGLTPWSVLSTGPSPSVEPPDATVIGFEESDGEYRVQIAGTMAVVATCDIPCKVGQRALEDDHTRRSVAGLLKRCADYTVALVPDGRA